MNLKDKLARTNGESHSSDNKLRKMLYASSNKNVNKASIEQFLKTELKF